MIYVLRNKWFQKMVSDSYEGLVSLGGLLVVKRGDDVSMECRTVAATCGTAPALLGWARGNQPLPNQQR